MKIIFSLALICALTACEQKSPNNVGATDTGITNGKAVNFLTDNLAHMVVGVRVLSHPRPDQTETHLCTAVLVANNVVLTAAHCLDAANSEAYVIFSPNINTAPTSTFRHVTSKSILPTWRKNSAPYEAERGDLALARFSGAPPSDYYSMVATDNANDVANGAKVFEFGYGATIAYSGEGEGVLHKAFSYLKSEYSSNYLEAKVAQSETMLCTGDLGGPIFVVDNGTWKIWGIASRTLNNSASNSSCGSTAVYTMTLPYKNWLHTEIQRLSR